MPSIKNYYIDEYHQINIENLKSRVLNREFNLSSNAIVGFINTHNQDMITFIFEKKCDRETLLTLSKLFLMTIKDAFPRTFSLRGYELLLESHRMSKFFHYHGKQSSLFCHSIVTRQTQESLMVAHTNIPPKDFAITVLNQFQTQLQDIFD